MLAERLKLVDTVWKKRVQVQVDAVGQIKREIEM